MANLLIIDDSEDMRILMGEFARADGHVVATASNGREAQKVFRTVKLDLVVTDMVMPEFDGVEVIQFVKQIVPRPRIIAVSGGGLAHAGTYLEVAKKLGAVAVLMKPFSAQDFVEAIRIALM